MPNTKTLSTDNMKLKVLVYGGSGTGKTTFASTFPKPFFFDFDGGMLSVRGKDVEYESYVDKSMLCPDAYNRFSSQLDNMSSALAGGHLPFQTVVLDSITTLQEAMLRDIQKTNKTLGKQTTLQEWGILVGKMEDILYRITSLNVHMVAIAHEQIIQDELTSEIVVLPLIVGKKLPDRIALWFDEVYHARVDRGIGGRPSYQVMTVADRKYKAKSRLNCFDVVETGFTFQKMIDKLALAGRTASSQTSSVTPA
jgi:hypothetical protein